jgi:hypothetical protein
MTDDAAEALPRGALPVEVADVLSGERLPGKLDSVLDSAVDAAWATKRLSSAMRSKLLKRRMAEESAESQAWLSATQAEESAQLETWDQRYLLRRATVPELQSRARARGVRGYSKMRKSELIASIEALPRE